MSKIKCINHTDSSLEQEKRIASVERFCLVEDDDGHWYCIRRIMLEAFNKWVEAMENDEETELDFEQYRLDGSPERITFTDPQEDN
jgi:hypothetical protein